MAQNIIGNGDGENGENDTYRIPGRGTHIPRAQLVSEVEADRHPGFSTYTINGETYIRSNPDNSTNNNVNRDQK